ncbi:hypothetical protein [Usitatibacter palustris]|uniref:DUF1579 domain-containing protein n=1 Tax=Usitatibacter palustris TaxID=2732487 RepID=A0A6M4H883_9PROT|nr:hypothetical protein [Usitatibacter palustris]QJR15899.1 hypothetical protein DSM104440_02725 [Usitatibacter palustris]
MRKLLLAAALFAAPSFAHASDPALEPLAFLAGHCWKGTLPGTSDTDEHCYSWIFDGKYLRDRHVVRRGDKAVYEGESVYFWSGESKRIEYFYFTAAGGHATGHMIPEADALSFPAAKLVMPTRSVGFRSKLKRVGDDGYEVFREYETDKGWMPVTVQMRKVAK